jgi:hypothetical protein
MCCITQFGSRPDFGGNCGGVEKIIGGAAVYNNVQK